MAPVPSELEVNASPARYLLKFESFSVLSANGIDKYESSVFDSSGYKWKLIIYPDGDGDGDGSEGRNHISVHLAIAGTKSLDVGWEVNATFSFLLFDQLHDTYLVMRGMAQRFHAIKTEWGFSRCISHETFRKPSNGYLVNDKCIFGVDVSVIKNQGIGECVSLLDPIMSYKHEWKISEFSKLKDKVYSDEFPAGDYKWKLLLFPAGNGCQKDHSISIYLVSVDAEKFDSQKRVYAKFTISVRNQLTGAHHERSLLHLFSTAEKHSGHNAFMQLREFKNPSKGCLVEDCCILEANVSVIAAVNDVSVIKNQREGDSVPLLDPIMSCKHKWKISKFSHLKDKVYSDEFPVGDYKWKLLLFPAGNGGEKDRSISIYLASVDAEKFDSGKRVHAKSRISVINQHTGAHYERSISHWFSAAENDWGFTSFMPLHEFKNPRKGYLVEDCCIVEADINLA